MPQSCSLRKARAASLTACGSLKTSAFIGALFSMNAVTCMPLFPVIVDERCADADLRRHARGMLVRFAVDIFLRALARDPQDVVAAIDADPENSDWSCWPI